jgi:L-lactate dehydrogenase complex protein LldG
LHLQIDIRNPQKAARAMNGREKILERVRSQLNRHGEFVRQLAPASPPPVPEVWPRCQLDFATLAARFASELREVHGETLRLQSLTQAQQHLLALLEQEQWSAIGAAEHPGVRALLAGLPDERVAWVDETWTPPRIAQLPASVVPAEFLLADTGSCLFSCPTAHQRLLCYLPPTCVVLGRVEQLVEHMPAAWETVAQRAAEADLRGEFVIVTGPSRTADIEKILILGVHGPQRLLVLLVD